MKIFENSSSISDLIASAMDKLKTIMDSSTIVGESIVTADGNTIIPISKVTVGFVVGGGEYADLSSRRVANHFPMSGGSSGGMSVSPVGFLVISPEGDVDYVNVENKSLEQTAINLFNTLLTKIQKGAEKKAKEASQQDEAEEGFEEAEENLEEQKVEAEDEEDEN